MIQLATDPNASRSNWRHAPGEAKEDTLARRPRSGHAWPFIVRSSERTPGSQDRKRTPTSAASGS
ncbi:MAG TPA: hypothetical protein VFM98_11445 [Ramlibacter sp.]|uniref:hypothetical protein n=1 Tax=Ramlibacter sp. TaxID=1917967 RepID=UPI002D7FACED|nr:hypothetical protein [Ramlibacter sp.]HET8746211.1 hypothetical protein [Ramlibacter sp.]